MIGCSLDHKHKGKKCCSVLSSRLCGGTLRDDTKTGFVTDYGNIITPSDYVPSYITMQRALSFGHSWHMLAKKSFWLAPSKIKSATQLFLESSHNVPPPKWLLRIQPHSFPCVCSLLNKPIIDNAWGAGPLETRSELLLNFRQINQLSLNLDRLCVCKQWKG